MTRLTDEDLFRIYIEFTEAEFKAGEARKQTLFEANREYHEAISRLVESDEDQNANTNARLKLNHAIEDAEIRYQRSIEDARIRAAETVGWRVQKRWGGLRSGVVITDEVGVIAPNGAVLNGSGWQALPDDFMDARWRESEVAG